jgi:hypothetical protein
MTSIDKFNDKFEQSLKTLAVKGSVHLTIRRTISIALNVLGAYVGSVVPPPNAPDFYKLMRWSVSSRRPLSYCSSVATPDSSATESNREASSLFQYGIASTKAHIKTTAKAA